MLAFPQFDPTLKQSSFENVYHYQTFRTDKEVDSKEYLRTALRDRRLFFLPHIV